MKILCNVPVDAIAGVLQSGLRVWGGGASAQRDSDDGRRFVISYTNSDGVPMKNIQYSAVDAAWRLIRLVDGNAEFTVDDGGG